MAILRVVTRRGPGDEFEGEEPVDRAMGAASGQVRLVGTEADAAIDEGEHAEQLGARCWDTA